MSQAAIAVPSSNILEGVAWMAVSAALFACVTGVVRYLGSDMPAIEAAFLRYAAGLVILAPVFYRLVRDPPRASVLGFHAMRGVIHAFGVMLWFYAMARIPIAEVTAIGYLNPIFVTIGAALFLGESLHMRRVGGVVAGFVGALIILRPGFESINLGQLAQVCAAPFFAASYLIAKSMSGREDPWLIVAMLSAFVTLALLPGAIWQWRAPSAEEVAWLTLTAVLATGGHYALTRAFKAAPITVTQPVSFLQLVLAAAIGMAIFGEPLDIFVLAGGGLIVASVSYIARREAIAARKVRTPPALAAKF